MPDENSTNNTEGDQGDGTFTWEQIVETLPEVEQELYANHIKGLKSALQSERQGRQDMARQLREATQQLEAGSEIRAQFEQLTVQAEAAEKRATFYEEAQGQGVANLRLAWLAAQEMDVFDRRGNVDWEGLREQFPELFRQTQVSSTSRGNAGAGTAGTTPSSKDMTAMIRRAAGYQS
jgi:hypothetical protein